MKSVLSGQTIFLEYLLLCEVTLTYYVVIVSSLMKYILLGQLSSLLYFYVGLWWRWWVLLEFASFFLCLENSSWILMQFYTFRLFLGWIFTFGNCWPCLISIFGSSYVAGSVAGNVAGNELCCCLCSCW